MVGHQDFAQRVQLAHEVRKQFLQEACDILADLGTAVQQRLTALMDEAAPQREMQLRRDAWMQYQRVSRTWLRDTTDAWQAALLPAPVKPLNPEAALNFELVDEGVMENRIVAARLALAVTDRATVELDDLRLRIRKLEGRDDVDREDVLSPTLLCNALLEHWTAQGLSQDTWRMVQDSVLGLFPSRLKQAYANCNAFLVANEVLPSIDLQDRYRRVAPASAGAIPARPGALEVPGTPAVEQRTRAPAAARPAVVAPLALGRATSGAPALAVPVVLPQPATQAQARQGAQLVLGRLQQLLLKQRPKDFQLTLPMAASQAEVARSARKSIASGLAAALAAQTWNEVTSASAALASKDAAPSLAGMAARVRETSEALKTQATTPNEKATVEVVALMFQAILQEDRIPPGIRVWFARLQIPVLRLALADPEFFASLDHPARQLIDRMGSCALGFDASGIQASELEAEIKRVVQVIEQYPETGKRVYELVHDEFKKFLARFLTGSSVTQKVVSVAQQIELKETLTIQYTIEMRSLLQDIPVRDEIRDFFYKVWAEVLAVAAVAKGAQHPDTLGLKKTASDLIWAVSAKPNRSDRARVIQDLPPLLQQLRAGMGLLGVSAADQEVHIKVISATLADAFLSKTQAISREQIDVLAERLSRLEDFVSDEITEDLPLDAQSIEMMIGLEDSNIDIVTDGGSEPSAETLQWSQALELGAWFNLNYHGRLARVQYVWRSERGHLNLFSSGDGHSYLIQAGRLAAYLQAGLLAPQEAETLTVRATRDALDRLEADPERLLG